MLKIIFSSVLALFVSIQVTAQEVSFYQSDVCQSKLIGKVTLGKNIYSNVSQCLNLTSRQNAKTKTDKSASSLVFATQINGSCQDIEDTNLLEVCLGLDPLKESYQVIRYFDKGYCEGTAIAFGLLGVDEITGLKTCVEQTLSIKNNGEWFSFIHPLTGKCEQSEYRESLISICIKNVYRRL